MANAQAYIAERRRAEALAEIDRAKTTFFSNVSHELRTPLTLMLGPVTDAHVSAGQSLTGGALELVHRNGLRLRKLVNALLDFSRIEAGRMEARYEPVDLGGYTAELASAFESAVERGGLRYLVDCPPGAAIAHVDRDMWEKVVLNLISNAFKFTMTGEIAVSVEEARDCVVLRVRDTGTGIPAREVPRLFERFHRVEGARGRTQEGTGIGLALVQELVRLHGGTIAVTSEDGRGSTFTVSIPVGTSHLPAERIVGPRPPGPAGADADSFLTEIERWLPESASPGAVETAAPAPGVEAARIMLVDDNADMRTYLGTLLGQRWQVEFAANGREALALIGRRPPELVITDVMMPHLDGFGLLRELRADERTRQLPVLMLSARAGEEARIEGFQAGADDYLVKPFAARELVARVEAQLLRARLRMIEDEHRRRLVSIFEHAPVAIGVLRGPDHVYELANPAYSRAHRPPRHPRPARPRGSARACRSGRRGLARWRLPVRRAVSRPVVSRGVEPRAPSGELEECYFDFVYQPTFDERGKVDGIAVVAFEVTSLAIARQAAEDASRAKDEFLAMLGHELRNPLAPILTALQLLRLRGVQAGERERDHHRTAGAAPGRPGRRPPRRLADHPRKGPPESPADRAESTWWPRPSSSPAHCSNSTGTGSRSRWPGTDWASWPIPIVWRRSSAIS